MDILRVHKLKWIEIDVNQNKHFKSITKSINKSKCIKKYRVKSLGIHLPKDFGFRVLAGLQDPFDNLCCVERISI